MFVQKKEQNAMNISKKTEQTKLLQKKDQNAMNISKIKEQTMLLHKKRAKRNEYQKS